MAERKHKFAYNWRLLDGYPAPGVKDHRSTVFGTFVCGGGSTMGYNLAGYRHLGGVEIDPKIAAVYRYNNDPELMYVEDLRKFNGRGDLPDALYDLDVLDGSPPCTSFSMTGLREKGWGKRKQFREGQVRQVIDDLVFVYCDTIAKLKPRVCLLENVAGIVKGNARAYCRGILSRLAEAGYRVQVFVLNSARMGVPQHRQRTFFIGLRNDFAALPKLSIDVDEEPIKFADVIDDTDQRIGITGSDYDIWAKRKPCDVGFNTVLMRTEKRDARFNWKLVRRDRVCPTLCADDLNFTYDYLRRLNGTELSLVSSFPLDYQCTRKELTFVTGMCVPPVMMAHIADAIYNQWLRPIKEGLSMEEEELKKVKATAWRYLDLAGLGDVVTKLDAMGYFMAPASKSHHLAEPGGLAAHSIHVTYWLVRLTRAGIVSWEDKRSPYRIGMLHDLVKCRCYVVDPTWDGYGPTRYLYRQPELTGHGEASALFAMSMLGVRLTPVETACIVHHMGAFCLDNRELKEFDAALGVYPQEVVCTHTADLLASRLEESLTYDLPIDGEV